MPKRCVTVSMVWSTRSATRAAAAPNRHEPLRVMRRHCRPLPRAHRRRPTHRLSRPTPRPRKSRISPCRRRPGTSDNSVLGPDTSGSAAANPAAPPVPEPSSSAAAPSVAAPTQWLPQEQAQLTVLDKIYGSSNTVSAKVGAPFAVRFLTVTVLACWVRPPTLPPDTAAFLQVTDKARRAGIAAGVPRLDLQSRAGLVRHERSRDRYFSGWMRLD